MTEQIQHLLSDRVNALSVSATIAMAQKARELSAQGIDVIKLSLGEPDFQTPQHIKDAAKKAIDEGFTFYTPVPGIKELREAIAHKLKTENQLHWDAANVVVSTGAKQSLANVLMALINPGDEVIIFAPYWVSYSEIVKLAQGTPVLVNGALENDFKVTPEQVQEAITPNTKAVLYSSPGNPTGSVYTKEELAALVNVLEKHEQVFVIADEIYEYITFQPGYFSIGAFDSMRERVITVNGFSKGFSMTGWRVGYMAGPLWLAKACDKLQGQVTSGTCSIAQRAALAAISSDKTPTFDMVKSYLSRRDMMLEMLNAIEGIKTYVPQGAFYIFPDISAYFGKSFGDIHIKDANDFCMYILNHAHVATVSGVAFGAPNCMRLSYAASEDNLKEAVRRIKEALAKLS